MECLYCGSPNTTVSNSVKDGKKVLRERACKSCHRLFYTEETRGMASQTAIKTLLNSKRWQNRKK